MTVNVNPILQVIPFILLLGLMIGYKNKRAHPVLAGFIAAFLAWIFTGGKLSLQDMGSAFYTGVNGIMFSSVMIFAATALYLSEIGSVKAFVDLVRKALGVRYGWIVPGVLVFLLGVVVYLAGHGAANILAIGPMIYSITGWIPEIVVAIGVAACSSWTTSPASAETGMTAKLANISPEQYYLLMRPFTVIMWLVATALALYGSYKRRDKLDLRISPEIEKTSYSELLKKSLPFLTFIILVFLAPVFKLHSVIVPLITLLVAFLQTRKDINTNIQRWVEANRPLLTYLFYAGTFLGFINVIDLIGTFKTIAGVVAHVPPQVITVTAIIIGYIVGTVAGAYTAMTMALIHPILLGAGIPWQALGFVNYGIGLGAITCPAQVSVSALGIVFKTDIPGIVRNNGRYTPFLLIIPIIMSLIVL
jgi:heme/copper-type cytochrome/quinol oxidase subunit 2